MLTDLRAPVAEVEARMLAGLSAADVQRLRTTLDTCRSELASDDRTPTPA